MIDLIVETDIGRDADDFFAFCYLAATKLVRIRAVTVTPGDPDQVAVAKFLLRKFGLEDVKVGVPKQRGKKSVTPFHHEVLNYFGEPLTAEADGIGSEIIHEAINACPGPVELFAIGPLTNVCAFLEQPQPLGPFPPKTFSQATMQGGFCSYANYSPTLCTPLDKFKDMDTCPTFNLNGDKYAGLTFAGIPGLKRRFIGKNVCHGVYWNKERYQEMYDMWEGNALAPINIMLMASKMYFRKHPEKKFHDPTAAVCMLHPEVGTWVKGKPYRERGGWGTKLDPDGDDICVDLDQSKLWDYIKRGK